MAEGRYLFQVTEEYEEERIDRYISLLIDSLSRSFIQKLLKDGRVLVNEKPVKQNYRLKEGDEVSFLLPEAVEPDIRPEDIPLDILYEDDDVLVVNKPKGMVVHPAAGHYSHTLVNALMYHCHDSLSGINGVMRPGIVHRIDRDTTGSLLVCKNDMAHLSIAAQLKEHSIVRRYRAVVYGVIDQEEGRIDLPVGRDPQDRKRMAVGARNAKPAVTHYRVLQRFDRYTYIECRLETGRTHQIRVHMEAIGHPLLGDEVYRRNLPGSGKPPCRLQGQTLHAMILGFHHPRTGEYIETTAPLPDYFSHLLRILGAPQP
ncbi:MAG TPA: RluA family pseudouridine synthase [Candidatus Eisenbergiella intestinipullorum]|nr:RluA family pseudouridine synthase [Candidatus Eisenbergiella intestinipullorum]